MTTVRHAVPSHCPYCGRYADASTGIREGETPSPGDVSICISCGEYMMYDDRLQLIKPTISEFEIMMCVDDRSRIAMVDFRNQIKKRGPLPRSKEDK